MSGVHLHLLVNHAPILGAFFALALLLASFWYGRDVLLRTGLVVLVGVALVAGAAKLSGEPAEDAVEEMPGVTRAAIHEHEEMADIAFLAAAGLGVLALGALVRWRRTPVPIIAARVALAGTLGVAGLMAYTGLLGGQIRHTEVRPGATAADAIRIEPERTTKPEGWHSVRRKVPASRAQTVTGPDASPIRSLHPGQRISGSCSGFGRASGDGVLA